MTDHDTTTDTDRVRELYRTIYEEQAFDSVPEYYASDAVRHGGFQGELTGVEQLQGYLQAALGGLSDIEITEQHCLASGDIVVFDFDMSATHTGELLGVPATGNRFTITNAALFRLVDGKVVDEWPRTDRLGLLQGIDLVELPF